MVAGGRILEQSSFARGKELGIILTGAGVPATDPLLTLSGARSTELYVSFVGPSGFISGEQASRSARIVRLAGDTSLGSTRINGCALGVGCASTTQANEFRIEAFQAAPAVPLIIDAPILSPTPAIDEDESDSEAVVTGTGNEEIWRIRK